MSEAKEVVRKVEEAWARSDLASLDELISADVKNNDAPPGFPSGLEGAKFGHSMFMASFPDRSMQIHQIIGDGDLVAVRSSVQGTHTGAPFLGLPASGRQIDIEAVSIYRVAGGKIVEHWGLNDGMTLMMQLGIVKPPVPA